MIKDKKFRRAKIKSRIRGKVHGSAQKPRMSVFRSNSEIYVQLIDDNGGHTLAATSSKASVAEGEKSTPVQKARTVGKKIAEIALAAGISEVVFDRNGYLYHGRVKELAEGAREGGLKF